MITKLGRAELAMIMAVWLLEEPNRHDHETRKITNSLDGAY
jgi:hypothetical protein